MCRVASSPRVGDGVRTDVGRLGGSHEWEIFRLPTSWVGAQEVGGFIAICTSSPLEEDPKSLSSLSGELISLQAALTRSSTNLVVSCAHVRLGRKTTSMHPHPAWSRLVVGNRLVRAGSVDATLRLSSRAKPSSIPCAPRGVM